MLVRRASQGGRGQANRCASEDEQDEPSDHGRRVPRRLTDGWLSRRVIGAQDKSEAQRRQARTAEEERPVLHPRNGGTRSDSPSHTDPPEQ